MSMFIEIRHDYMYGPAVESCVLNPNDDTLAAVTIDAWTSSEDDAEGTVLATVVLTKSGDIVTVYHNNGMRMDDDVTRHISEAKAALREVWDANNI